VPAEELIKEAAKLFNITELSGDKGYLSRANMDAVASIGATPYIMFKDNSKGDARAEVWDKMWHLFSLQREEFLQHYHKRSNVESTFSAVKRLFGGSVRAKNTTAQLNEVYLKCLCFNLTCLVHAIHELGLDPRFFNPDPLPESA
jgi:transposase